MNVKEISNFTFFGTAAMAAATLATSPADAQDAAGGYGGVSVSLPDGQFFTLPEPYGEMGGQAIGLFAGYNVPVGDNLYLGIEGSYTGSFDAPDSDYFQAELSQMFDIRGRVGTMVGSTFVYGAAGMVFGEAKLFGGGLTSDVSGLSFGLGAEFSVMDKGFVGAELTQRSLDGDNFKFSSMTMRTLSIRGGIRF